MKNPDTMIESAPEMPGKGRIAWRRAAVLAAVTALAATAGAAEITLPAEQVKLVESPLPGYALAQSMCMTCHSADYIAYQPPSSPAYWKAATLKMRTVFGAPIPESAVEPIAEYLAKTYGADRGERKTQSEGSKRKG